MFAKDRFVAVISGYDPPIVYGCQLSILVKYVGTLGAVDETAPDVRTGPDPTLLEAWRQVVRPFADFRARWYEVSRTLGLSPAAVTALLSVDPDDPRPMRDLAVLLDCDASYVTGMVDDLEQAGYAERQVSPSDRRVKVVGLTADGVRARALAEDALVAPPPALLSLSRKDQRTLARLLRRAAGGS
jgi:DNA-binding MarR family transcriptional regulator